MEEDTSVASEAGDDDEDEGKDHLEPDDLEKEENVSKILNVHILKAADLIKIPVKILNYDAKAMLDCGAACSFIKESLFLKLKMVMKKDIMELKGFGGKIVRTEGQVAVEMWLAKFKINMNLNVMKDEYMAEDLILGVDFFKDNGVELDLKRKQMKMNRKDGGMILIKIKEGAIIDMARYDRIPVYARSDNTCRTGESGFIGIEVPQLNMESNEFIFEGVEGEVEFVCGILTRNEGNVMYVNRGEKNVAVKEGDRIGHVSMLIEGEEGQLTESWTIERVREEIDLNNSELNRKEKEQVYEMLRSVSAVLSKGDTDIGNAKVAPHKIILNDHTPKWQKPRNFAQPVNEEIEQQCGELLANDIIEYSSSSWSSPCVPVRKSDGSIRLCIDYRKVNSATLTEKYPMPNLSHCIYKAHRMKIFTKIDLVKGYYQMAMEEDSKQYTAFSTPHNHYQFKRLPFGLKNSGIAFQRVMQQILAPYRSSNVIVYIDDVLIMTETLYRDI